MTAIFDRASFWLLAALILVSATSVPASGQSEFLRGEGMPYEAFDRLPKITLAVPGGVVHVGIAPGELTLPQEQVLEWVRRSAQAVSTYYGAFPVKSLRLLLVPVDGSRVRGGTTWGYRGAAIRVLIGRTSTEEDLQRDWVMVHEMVHLALPDMSERYNWLSEGLAVYVEPISRVKTRDLRAPDVWKAMMRDMPKGLPKAGDEGLDNTDTWGRRYWGGAIFCLLADIEIRRQTANRLGLQDAMRGVLAAGGNHEAVWPIERIIAVADRSVGLDVLRHLHEEMGGKPAAPDLESTWRNLGVTASDDGVRFDDTAPLADIRRAIAD